MFPEERQLEGNNSSDTLFSEASAVSTRTSDQTVRGNNLSSKIALRGELLLLEDSDDDLLQPTLIEQPAVKTTMTMEEKQPSENTTEPSLKVSAGQKTQEASSHHGYRNGGNNKGADEEISTQTATQYLQHIDSNQRNTRMDTSFSTTAQENASVFSGPLGDLSLLSGETGDQPQEAHKKVDQEQEDEEDDGPKKDKSNLPRRGRTDTTPGSSSPKKSSGSRAKYKDTDTKRVESNRRRSRSRDAESRRQRSRSRSQDPASRVAERRRSKSQDLTNKKNTTDEAPPPRRRVSRRSHSQDPVLKEAQDRLKKGEKARSKSQDPVEKSGKLDDVKNHRSSHRQGRRPQTRTSTSKRTSGMGASTSSHTTSNHSKSTSASASQPRLSRRSLSTPVPTVVAEPVDCRPHDPILAQYLGEGSRAFDSILGLEAPTVRSSVSHQSSGQQSNENERNPSENPIPPPPPMPEAELRSPRMTVARDSKGYSTPQPQTNKMFYATKNPHFSPHILHVNSMAKKVAGDRWLQDETVKVIQEAARDGDSSERRAQSITSLDAHFTAFTDEKPDFPRSLASDDRSYHSQDQSPMAPIRKGFRRSGQKPKTNEKPLLDESLQVSPKKAHSLLIGDKKNSPKKQLRKIADKVVSTSKNILNASAGKLDDGRSPSKKSPMNASKLLNLGGVKQPSFGRLPAEDDDNVFDHGSFYNLDGSFNGHSFDSDPNVGQQNVPAWGINDDGTRSSHEVKRKSVLQNARRRVSTLLKTGGKGDSKKNPDGWGALGDSNSSIEAGEDKDTSTIQPEANAQKVLDELKGDHGEDQESLVKSPSALVVTPEPPASSSPSSPLKVSSQSAVANQDDVVTPVPKKQPISPRKSKSRRNSSSSPINTRNRSASPPNSSTRQSTKQPSKSRSVHSISSPFDYGSNQGDASIRIRRKSRSSKVDLDTALERHRHARSRSSSRPDESTTSNIRELVGKDDGEFERNDVTSTSRIASPRTSSKQASRSSSPHSLRSARTSASISSRDRTTKQRHSSSSSPGLHRSSVSKRRDAMQKLRSSGSLRTIGLPIDEESASRNPVSQSVASGSTGVV